MAGSYYYGEERKKEVKVDHEQINERLEDKKGKWIRELEAREAEERELEERARRLREKREREQARKD